MHLNFSINSTRTWTGIRKLQILHQTAICYIQTNPNS